MGPTLMCFLTVASGSFLLVIQAFPEGEMGNSGNTTGNVPETTSPPRIFALPKTISYDVLVSFAADARKLADKLTKLEEKYKFLAADNSTMTQTVSTLDIPETGEGQQGSRSAGLTSAFLPYMEQFLGNREIPVGEEPGFTDGMYDLLRHMLSVFGIGGGGLGELLGG